MGFNFRKILRENLDAIKYPGDDIEDEEAINYALKYGRRESVGIDNATKPSYSLEIDKLPEDISRKLKLLYDNDTKIEIDDHLYTVDKILGSYKIKRWR
jgi:hypothetical protein